MGIRESYNAWADQYDTNANKTRDLEAVALRQMLGKITFKNVLEIGCGTGKNSIWLNEKAKHLTAVDFSEKMLAKAKEKPELKNVNFIQADITNAWSFTNNKFDLITFSLVLEHTEHLDHIFSEAYKSLENGGFVYIGELHPFKQYVGTKARFETARGIQVLECFHHHLSDFLIAAKKVDFSIESIEELFDENNKTFPRILALLFYKK